MREGLFRVGHATVGYACERHNRSRKKAVCIRVEGRVCNSWVNMSTG